MRLAFKKNITSPYGWLIQLWTRGPYCHCELIFSDGWWFSADEEDGGTRFIFGPKKEAEYDYLDIPISAEDEKRIRHFCEEENGLPYDKIGVAFSFLPIPLGYQNPHAWFCSEICTAGLQIACWCVGYTPARVHPNKFNKLLKRELKSKNITIGG